MAEDDDVVARPEPILTGLRVFISLFSCGLLFWAAESMGSCKQSLALTGFLEALGLVLLAVNLWKDWRYGHQKVMADSHGLRWLNTRRWQSCTWEDITDFYIEDGSNFFVQRYFFRVDFGENRRAPLRIAPDFRGATAMMKFIVRQTGERLGLDSWVLRGLRPRDFPQVFGYNPAFLRRGILFAAIRATLGAMVFLGCFTALVVFLPFHERFDAGAAFCCALLLLIFEWLMREPLLTIGLYRAALKRCADRFIAEKEGFTFDDGRESVFVRWENVIGYDFNQGVTHIVNDATPHPISSLKIRTDQGQEFTFLLVLDRIKLWMDIVRVQAINAHESRIDTERKDAIGGIRTQWSGGIEGVGDRVFSAANWKNVRAFWLATFLLALFARRGMNYYHWVSFAPRRTETLSLLGVCLLLMAAEFVWLKAIRLQIGREGITYLRPGKHIRVLWSEIDDVEHTSGTFTVVKRDGTTLRIVTLFLSFKSQIGPRIDEHLLRSSSSARDLVRADDGEVTAPAVPQSR